MHLESLAFQGDIEAREELANQPPLPPLAAYLWRHFADLSSTRQSNGMAISRLSRAEIRLFEEDEGVKLERWERRAIMAIDAAWVRINTDPDTA